MKKYILGFVFVYTCLISAFSQNLNVDKTTLTPSVSEQTVARIENNNPEEATSNNTASFKNRGLYSYGMNRSLGPLGLGAVNFTPYTFGSYVPGTDVPMRLVLFDDGSTGSTGKFGIGYYEETLSGTKNRVMAFYLNYGTVSRYGFFDNYTANVAGSANGNEFVTFYALRKSVGIGNTSPSALLHISGTTYNSNNNLAIFEGLPNGLLTSRLIFTGNSGYGARNNIDGYGYTNSTTPTQTSAPLLLQPNSGGFVGIGTWYAPPANSPNYFNPASLLHLQMGNLQISNSGAPAPVLSSKSGISIGAVGTQTVASTDYSWIQASSGPLVLNPLGTNSMATSGAGSTQNNNYVAIGFTPPYTSTGQGNAIPAGYNLIVQGKILCEEMKIELKSNWYDHVLKPGYKLMTLDSLQLYINKNSHLPDIPSAEDVKKNGIMAGEMNGLLLKKVEELTLYMIEQKKNSDNLETQIELLKKQNELLMQQVQLLVNQKSPTGN